MKTKKVKKKKLNIARTLVFILFIYIIICFGIYIYKEPVRHVEITGEKLVSEADIMRLTGLVDYPPYVSVNTSKTAELIESMPLVKSAKVRYGFGFTINITIEENTPTFIIKSTNEVYLSDGSKIENDGSYLGLPILLNNTPEKFMQALSSELSKLDNGILYLINDIEYSPTYNDSDTPIEEERYLLSMTDGNTIFITRRKISLLNKYLDVIESINTKGTLYFDSDSEGYLIKKYVTTTTESTEEKTTETTTSKDNKKNTTTTTTKEAE